MGRYLLGLELQQLGLLLELGLLALQLSNGLLQALSILVALLPLGLEGLHQRHLLLRGKLCAVQPLAYLLRLLPEALGVLLGSRLCPAHLSHAQPKPFGLGTHLQLPLPFRLQGPLEALCLLCQLLCHLLLVLLQPPGLLLSQILLLLQQLRLCLEPSGLLNRLHLLFEHLLCQGALLGQVLLRQLPQPCSFLGRHSQPRGLLRHLLHLLGLLLQEALRVVLVPQNERAVLCLDAGLELAQLLHLHAHREELLLHLAALAGSLRYLRLQPLQLLVQDALLVVGLLQLQPQCRQLLLHLRLLPQGLLSELLVLLHLRVGSLLLPQSRLLRLGPPSCLLLSFLAQLLGGGLGLRLGLRLLLRGLLQALCLLQLPAGLRRLALGPLPRFLRLLRRPPGCLCLAAQPLQHALLLLEGLL